MIMEEQINELNTSVQKGKARDAKRLTQELIDGGAKPKDILNEGLLNAMSIVGEKFKNNEVFVPEVLIAARALNMSLKILKPHLISAGVESIGSAIICTVKGDLHDIGKNLVKMMLEGAGLEVFDLGADVGSDVIIEKIKETNAKVVCLSALLTTTMTYQKTIVEDITAAGIRDQVKIMIGGAPCTQDWCDEIGADAFTEDAASAAEVAKAYFAA